MSVLGALGRLKRKKTYQQNKDAGKAVVTIRMTAELHTALMAKARENKTTLNGLCVEKLKELV